MDQDPEDDVVADDGGEIESTDAEIYGWTEPDDEAYAFIGAHTYGAEMALREACEALDALARLDDDGAPAPPDPEPDPAERDRRREQEIAALMGLAAWEPVMTAPLPLITAEVSPTPSATVVITPLPPSTPSADEVIAGLQAQLAAAHDAIQSLRGGHEAAVAEIRAEMATVAAAHAEHTRKLEDEVEHHRNTAEVLSRRLEIVKGEHAALEAELNAMADRQVFQIIPKHRVGQGKDTRIYVLADDAIDAIERVVRRGVIDRKNVDNVAVTSQKLITR